MDCKIRETMLKVGDKFKANHHCGTIKVLDLDVEANTIQVEIWQYEPKIEVWGLKETIKMFEYDTYFFDEMSPEQSKLDIVEEYRAKGKLSPDFIDLMPYELVQSGYPLPNHGVMIPRVYGGTNADGELLYSNADWCKLSDVRKYLANQEFPSVMILTQNGASSYPKQEKAMIFVSEKDKKEFIAEWISLNRNVCEMQEHELAENDRKRGFIAHFSGNFSTYILIDKPNLKPFSFIK